MADEILDIMFERLREQLTAENLHSVEIPTETCGVCGGTGVNLDRGLSLTCPVCHGRGTHQPHYCIVTFKVELR